MESLSFETFGNNYRDLPSDVEDGGIYCRCQRVPTQATCNAFDWESLWKSAPDKEVTCVLLVTTYPLVFQVTTALIHVCFGADGEHEKLHRLHRYLKGKDTFVDIKKRGSFWSLQDVSP